MTYKSGQKIVCEKCNETLDDPVDDFVIPGRVGSKSRSDDQCGYCDWEFSVERNKDGTFDVEAI